MLYVQIHNVSSALEGCTFQPIADLRAQSPQLAVHAFTFPHAAATLSNKNMAEVMDSVRRSQPLLSNVVSQSCYRCLACIPNPH